jgi:hypothetical protein
MKKKATRGTGGPAKPPDDPEQSRRFEEAARDTEADTSGKAFKRAVNSVLPKRAKSIKRS